ncbi:sugar phosphate isomerase/epimerase [Neobacillus mesonae]|uniref:sugar phosphate isomerase/epimerase family protein n=1 Tax=Neobacillus mesonae TaxID=1193713 RepID=UPI00203E26F5|nr:sugar phosphate isomerase/epimerase [Neobacillus mesonae]MCM3567511.1 sugar phosphate isomerase/epimerase [Neobacillus mesonae]
MTREFSMSYLTALGCSPPEMTYIAKQAGYDFVGFRSITPHDRKFSAVDPSISLSKNKEMLRKTKTALNETGIKLLDLEVVVIYDGVDPKEHLSDFEAAAELGGRHVLTVIRTSDRHQAIECYSELCELAKPFGLTIDLEFVTWFNVSTLKGAIDIVKSAGCDNGGILIDPLHFHRSRIHPNELENVPKEWLHYAQLCDAPAKIPATQEELIYTATKERLYVGEGGIDLASILSKMPEIPYAIEIPNVKRIKELGVEKFARNCLQTAKEYLDRSLLPQ